MFEKLKIRLGLTPPVVSQSAMESVEMETESGAAQQIVMYTTRFCPYCIRAKQLLDSKGWSFKDIAVDGNPGLREEMMRKSGRHTVPQIWIGEQHVGGCDELMQLERTGQLDPIVLGEK